MMYDRTMDILPPFRRILLKTRSGGAERKPLSAPRAMPHPPPAAKGWAAYALVRVTGVGN